MLTMKEKMKAKMKPLLNWKLRRSFHFEGVTRAANNADKEPQAHYREGRWVSELIRPAF